MSQEPAPDDSPQRSDDPFTETSHAQTPPRQPVWMTLLTPFAIILGAVIVAAAILVSGDDNPTDAPPAAESDDGTMSTQPTQPAGAVPTTMFAALQGYAEQLDLDVEQFEQCMSDGDRAEPINRHLALGSQLGVTGTPTFFVNDKMIVGAQPTSIFVEVIERELEGPPISIDEYSESIQELAATEPPRFAITGETVELTGAEIEGNPNADVVVAEFSDFQCPFCQRWVQQSMEPIRDLLGDDVALAFMHFPLTQMHPNAGFASFASICAGEQGSFWDMHDLLFARQQEWADLPAN